jgi:hypothetical protein
MAAMEVGFLCPPAGLNIYFASARFNKSIRYVAASVVPALGAILVGRLLIALLSVLSTGLPRWVLEMEPCDQRFLRSGAPCWSIQFFQRKHWRIGVTVDAVDSLIC